MHTALNGSIVIKAIGKHAFWQGSFTASHTGNIYVLCDGVLSCMLKENIKSTFLIHKRSNSSFLRKFDDRELEFVLSFVCEVLVFRNLCLNCVENFQNSNWVCVTLETFSTQKLGSRGSGTTLLWGEVKIKTKWGGKIIALWGPGNNRAYVFSTELPNWNQLNRHEWTNIKPAIMQQLNDNLRTPNRRICESCKTRTWQMKKTKFGKILQRGKVLHIYI